MFKSDPKGAKSAKLDSKKMDLDTLDELISKCEDSMVHPFKKKVEVKPDEGSALEEKGESADEEKAEAGKSDLSDMDMEDLLRLYKEMQAGKE